MAVSAAADIKRPLAGINMDQSLEVHFNLTLYTPLSVLSW